jgi:hypothetical protein
MWTSVQAVLGEGHGAILDEARISASYPLSPA